MTDYIDLRVEAGAWTQAHILRLADTALTAVYDRFAISKADWQISLLATDDAGMRKLNRDFRDKDRATNVLSWPAFDLMPKTAGKLPNPDGFDDMVGDIALGYETCRSEAEALGRSFDDHITHLLVHGCLHLIGYDHQNDTDAADMERTETQILASLGVDDPYKEID